MDLRGSLVIIFGLTYFGVVIYSGFVPTDNINIDLWILVYELVIIQYAFLFFVILRRRVTERVAIGKTPCEENVMAYSYLRILGLRVNIPSDRINEERQIFFIFNILAIIGAAIFAASFTSLPFARHMGPIAVVLLGLGIFAGSLNCINLISLRIRLNVFVMLLFLAWFFGAILPDPYEVKLEAAPKANYFNHRLAYSEYFNKWFERHKKILENEKVTAYPVYFVLADGGASRSGYWVASVLGAWEDQSISHGGDDTFSKHLFCLSGASGGSVGNATFYALLKFNQGAGASNEARAKAFLKNDFLSYTLAHYLGPDMLHHLLPFLPYSDRAGALAYSLAKSSEDSLYGAFNLKVSQVIDTTATLPIIFLNVTSVQRGEPSVVSSIKLFGLSKRLDILDTLDKLGNNNVNMGDMSFSTATILSARFPYVSPAGKIGNGYYVDGGYFDNSGSGVVQELLEGIHTIIKNDTSHINRALYSKLKFKVIHISNTPDQKALQPINPLLNDLATPLITVLGTYGSQTETNDQRLENLMVHLNPEDSKIKKVNLYREHLPKGATKESYPMNWVISQYHLNQMNARLKEVDGFSEN